MTMLLCNFLQFFHGRRTDNFTENYLYGRLEIPFLVISKNNRLRIRFVTNEENTFTGYRADIRGRLRTKSCDFDSNRFPLSTSRKKKYLISYSNLKKIDRSVLCDIVFYLKQNK